MSRKILIMGLPGAGKTTLAKALVPLLNAVLFNADEVRQNVHTDLGFSLQDRITHARRMGWLCDKVVDAGVFAIADFICPTEQTRAAFGPAFSVWVDRGVTRSPYPDTDAMFEPPLHVDVRVTASGTPRYWAERIVASVRPLFDQKKPTALLLGRYQPFHEGHLALIEESIRRVGQACIAVRDTSHTDGNNPFGFESIRARIHAALRHLEGRFVVVQVPNVTHVFYGRDVGYAIQQIDLEEGITGVSGTAIRMELRLPDSADLKPQDTPR